MFYHTSNCVHILHRMNLTFVIPAVVFQGDIVSLTNMHSIYCVYLPDKKKINFLFLCKDSQGTFWTLLFITNLIYVQCILLKHIVLCVIE